MLQTFRDNLKGTLAVIVVGLMIIPFALFGVDSLFLQDNTVGKAAEVDGNPIYEVDLSRAVRNQKQQLLQQYGEQAPVELLSDENLRPPVLERLVQREIIETSAERGGMIVADSQLDQLIVLSPQFQQAGKFDPELYKQLLRSSGFTPTTYKQLLAQDILVRQHISGITDTAFMTSQDIEDLIALSQQTRSFNYLTLSQAAISDEIEVTDADIKDYFESNQARFMSKEMIAIEYIELSLDELADGVDVAEADIAAQYQENLKSFTGSALRQAAHILIEDKEDDSHQQTVAEVTEKLAEGVSFETLVSEYSDDLGSREMGGDLGVTDGSTFPESFEAALAALELEEVSGPIQTEAGTHFIKLLSIQQAEAPSLEESYDAIRAEIALAEAESVFVELLDALPDATYNAEDLSAASDELGLEVKTSGLFGRVGGEGITSNNQVLAMAFSDEILQDRQITDLIELGDDHVVVLRVSEHKPSAVKPFEDVAAEVKQILVSQRASAELEQLSADIEQQLRDGSDIETIATQNDFQWQAAIDANRAQPGYPGELLGYVFAMSKPQQQSSVGSVQLNDGDWAVIMLNGVKKGELPELDEQQQLGLQQSVNQQQGATELSLFETEKRSAAEVTVY
ncbi:MAG: SurA N-terminal domain-containing protein [Candidatus Pelagadaptatus aseana]|uniref:SurA N-terminal domain-containing protein n=1 Tax=Candidatus Pelagadaptatus aseana TaxID=3120508 RepID=UPI0039B23A4F